MAFKCEDDIYLVLQDLDYHAQLSAIRNLLFWQKQSKDKLEADIKEAEVYAAKTSGALNEHAVDELTDLLHSSCYEHAAYSMAAVGMLAPLVESVFRQGFQDIAETLPQGALAKNITRLVDKVDMTRYMPKDINPMLSALFDYRNKMFHCGFEWPIKERQRFEDRLNNSDWPSNWFLKATSGEEPWMFYMSPKFVELCLDRTEQIIEGIRRFAFDVSSFPISDQDDLCEPLRPHYRIQESAKES